MPTDVPTDFPTGPGGAPLTGTLTRTPVAGPAGTVVTVASVTKCVDAKGVVGKGVDVVLFGMNDLTNPNADPGPAAEKISKVGKDGAWTVTLAAPKTAKSGDTFMVMAACFVNDSNQDAFLIYDPQYFMVTDAPTAPVAAPVTKAPSFTG